MYITLTNTGGKKNGRKPKVAWGGGVKSEGGGHEYAMPTHTCNVALHLVQKPNKKNKKPKYMYKKKKDVGTVNIRFLAI